MELKIEKLDEVAREFVAWMGDKKIFALIGEMGVGKTTFIRGICKALGVKDMVDSPTFAIVNEYYSEQLNDMIYHFDFYRIKDIREAVDIGVEEYFDSGALCFIEWADRIESLLPEETVFVTIEERLNGLRAIEMKHGLSPVGTPYGEHRPRPATEDVII